MVLQAQLRDVKVLIEGSSADQLLQYGIVLIPLIGVLVAGAARLRPGGRLGPASGGCGGHQTRDLPLSGRTGLFLSPDDMLPDVARGEAGRSRQLDDERA